MKALTFLLKIVKLFIVFLQTHAHYLDTYTHTHTQTITLHTMHIHALTTHVHYTYAHSGHIPAYMQTTHAQMLNLCSE